MDLIGDGACGDCMKDIKPKSSFLKSGSVTCVVCSRQFCSNCAFSVDFSTSFSKTIITTVCNASCRRFINKLQLLANPWHNCAASSKLLFELEAMVSDEHTQLCARLSNYEGLVRFFVDNADRLPRQDMLGTLPELEELIRGGISKLTLFLKQGQSVPAVGKDIAVKQGLVNFITGLLTRVKSQYSMSQNLHRRLLEDLPSSPRFFPQNNYAPETYLDTF